MLEHAVNAHLPLVVVQTDDLLYAEETIRALTGRTTVLRITDATPLKAFSNHKTVFYTDDQKCVTLDWANKMAAEEHTLIVLNGKPQGLAFDAGLMMPPDALIKSVVKEVTGQSPQSIAQLAQGLKGLSLKQVNEVLSLCIDMHGSPVKPELLRQVRSSVGPNISGLTPLPTAIPFYDPPPALDQWLKAQTPYFVDPKHPPYLRPRGIMMAGHPGTGKTLGAKYLAGRLGVPLYRLDVATTLSRYIGESEARLASSLALLDKEEPCVVLMDEVEKLFANTEGDNAVISRMLSQLLWWLQEHTSRVLTIMTTNHLQRLPAELYREGRMDMVLEVPLLSPGQAISLSHQIWKSMANGKVDLKQLQALGDIIKQVSQMQQDTPRYSHAWVNKVVIDTAKANKWLG